MASSTLDQTEIQSDLMNGVHPKAMSVLSRSALLQAYLSQTPPTRPSNRSPTQTRPIHLNTSSLTHCNGSSVVKIGEATIVCGIRAEILPVSEIPFYRTAPAPTSNDTASNEGPDDDEAYAPLPLYSLLVPNLELSTGSGPTFPATSAPSPTAQSLSQRLLSLLHTSRVVRASDLEIRYSSPNMNEQGTDVDEEAYIEPEVNVLKAYWVLYIDCMCLSYGGQGATFDAAWLAIYAALRDVRLPRTWWDADEKVVLASPVWEEGKSLRISGMPVSLGLGVFGFDEHIGVNGATGVVNGKKNELLIDLDMFEDGVCEEKGTIVIDCSGGGARILRLEKSGGQGALGINGIKEVVRHAERRWKEWGNICSRS